MIDLLMPTIAQGLLWAIMALGVYITYRVLDIADLTVEGSFPLGAAVAASLLAGLGDVYKRQLRGWLLVRRCWLVCWLALRPDFYILSSKYRLCWPAF